jgi:3-oxoacyl-(acyl-carrier-protein) synthase
VTAVVITGVGAVHPAGTELALADASARPAVSGPLPDVLGTDLPDAVRTRVARAERVTQLMARAAGRALAMANCLPADGPPRRECGIVAGTAFGCLLSNGEHQVRLRASGPSSVSPRIFAATVSNAAAGEIGIAYRLGGAAVTLTSGAASGLAAVLHGADLVEAGHCRTVLAGGGDALGPLVHGWMAAAAFETHALAEAAAFLVLDTTETAAARGVLPLATVLGGAIGFDPDPAGGKGLRAAVQAALRRAGVTGDEIGVVVRGAPPPLRAAEARVLAEVVEGTDAQVLPVKSWVGETLGAAGPVGVLAALAALAPGAVALLLDVCNTGHIAILAVRRENGAFAGRPAIPA